MKFEPVSDLPYVRLIGHAQTLVFAKNVANRWKARATASVFFEPGTSLRALVIDLLANPQVRVLVYDDEPGPVLDPLKEFWSGLAKTAAWEIAPSHVTLVRQFVDLYEGDCGIRGTLQPFWPERIRYDSRPQPNKHPGESAVDPGHPALPVEKK